MEVIGKRINFIKLHDFLDRIEVEQVYSTLHELFSLITAGKGPDEEIEFRGAYYTKSSLLHAMKQEEGVMSEAILTERKSIILKFTSGNEIVIKVKDQLQYLQILQYIMEV